MNIKTTKMATVTPIAIPTCLPMLFNRFETQFSHFFAITAKSEKAQKNYVLV